MLAHTSKALRHFLKVIQSSWSPSSLTPGHASQQLRNSSQPSPSLVPLSQAYRPVHFNAASCSLSQPSSKGLEDQCHSSASQQDQGKASLAQAQQSKPVGYLDASHEPFLGNVPLDLIGLDEQSKQFRAVKCLSWRDVTSDLAFLSHFPMLGQDAGTAQHWAQVHQQYKMLRGQHSMQIPKRQQDALSLSLCSGRPRPARFGKPRQQWQQEVQLNADHHFQQQQQQQQQQQEGPCHTSAASPTSVAAMRALAGEQGHAGEHSEANAWLQDGLHEGRLGSRLYVHESRLGSRLYVHEGSYVGSSSNSSSSGKRLDALKEKRKAVLASRYGFNSHEHPPGTNNMESAEQYCDANQVQSGAAADSITNSGSSRISTKSSSSSLTRRASCTSLTHDLQRSQNAIAERSVYYSWPGVCEGEAATEFPASSNETLSFPSLLRQPLASSSSDVQSNELECIAHASIDDDSWMTSGQNGDDDFPGSEEELVFVGDDEQGVGYVFEADVIEDLNNQGGSTGSFDIRDDSLTNRGSSELATSPVDDGSDAAHVDQGQQSLAHAFAAHSQGHGERLMSEMHEARNWKPSLTHPIQKGSAFSSRGGLVFAFWSKVPLG